MNKNTIKGIVIGVVAATAVNFTGIAEAGTIALKGYFTDTLSKSGNVKWWAQDAEWAKDAGLMGGYDGKFDGDAPLTRGQLATVLHNLDKQGKFADSQPVIIEEGPIQDIPEDDIVVEVEERVTLAAFNQVQVGMTVAQVVSLFGSQGVIESSGEYGDGETFETRTWDYEYSYASVSFENGKVSSKSQYGLE